MVKIAIFKSEDDEIFEDDWKYDAFEYSKLYELLSPCFFSVDVDNMSTLMTVIHDVLKIQEGEMIEIKDFYYDDIMTLQVFFKHGKRSYDKTAKYKGLLSQLIHEETISDIVVIKRHVGLTKTPDYIDVTLNDVIMSFESLFIHKGVVLRPDFTQDEFKYIRYPIEWMDVEEMKSSIRSHEHIFLNFVLCFYIDITAKKTDENINTIASNIYGKKIYGQVWVSLRDNEDSSQKHVNLDRDLFKKIIDLSHLKKELNKDKYILPSVENLLSEDSPLNTFPNILHCPNFYYIVNEEHNIVKREKSELYDMKILKCDFTECLNDEL